MVYDCFTKGLFLYRIKCVLIVRMTSTSLHANQQMMNGKGAVCPVMKGISAICLLGENFRRRIEHSLGFYLKTGTMTVNLGAHFCKSIIHTVIHHIAQHPSTWEPDGIFAFNETLQTICHIFVCQMAES